MVPKLIGTHDSVIGLIGIRVSVIDLEVRCTSQHGNGWTHTATRHDLVITVQFCCGFLKDWHPKSAIWALLCVEEIIFFFIFEG